MGLVFPKKRYEFAAVMREHAPTMRARLKRAGLFGADIDDCMQDAFVTAWSIRDQMPIDQKRRAGWFGTIAFHVSNSRRRELRRTHYVGPLDAFVTLAGASESNTEAPAMLAEMLDRVPERYHEIVQLRAQGYTLREVAQMLGKAWTTVDAQWRRACVAMGARNG